MMPLQCFAPHLLRVRAVAVVSLALPAMLAAMPADAQRLAGSYSLHGTVERVLDGDTVLLDTGARRHRTVRLASIDAPEARKPDRPGQPFAHSSRQALTDLVQGRRVTASCYETDSYERDICELLLPDGRSVNRAMVQAGMAWANMEGRGKYLRDPALPGVQREAQAARRGLWSRPSAMAPWRWRYTCWRKGQCR